MASDPQVAAIAAQLRAEIAKAATALTLEITANLTEATPVDTGHARANWVPSIAEPQDGEVAGTGMDAQAAGILAVARYQLGDGPLNITNNTPYIERLIGGSSSQAPAGWDVAAIDQALQTVQAQYDGLEIDVTRDDGGATVAITPRSPGGET
jgi:hypothetical protein